MESEERGLGQGIGAGLRHSTRISWNLRNRDWGKLGPAVIWSAHQCTTNARVLPPETEAPEKRA
eukprot:351125-Chlamydomonas_euryale.AAC.6